MASYLITGCSRGLGLELTKQLLASPPSVVGAVFATARSPSASGQLEETLKASGGRGHFVQLDVLDLKSIAAAADAVSRIVGAAGLDVVINNAGIQILETDGASGMHALEDSFNTNVLAVHHILQAFLPLLRQGNAKKIVNISSTLGSIGMKEYSRLAPFPSYKVSKAALNMLTVQYSMELQAHGFTCFTLSPGWLQTDLGGPRADLPPSVGAKGVLDVVFNSTSEDNGAFKNIHVPGNDTYDGKNPPW